MDMEWLQRLDAATDYAALHTSLFGPAHHTSGEELWAKCPLHPECDDAGKWSVNTRTGQWKCFRTGEGGAYISLVRKLRPQSWRDDWRAACPRTVEVFESGMPTKSPGLRSNQQTVADFASTARDGAARTTDAELLPLSEKWSIPVDVLREMGWFVLTGGREGGKHPKFCVSVYNAEDQITGIRIRFLEPYPIMKMGDGEPKVMKSRLMKGSKIGVIGMAQLKRATPDGVPLPILIVEGEKDWAVAVREYGDRFAVASTSHGSSTFPSAFLSLCQNRDVTLLYDEDDAGNKGARTALTLLRPVAASVKWAHLGVPGKDLFNLIREDGAKATVDAALEAAEPFTMDDAVKDVAALIRASIEEDKQPDVMKLANHIYDVLHDAGAMWISGLDGNAYCNMDGRAYCCATSDHGWVVRIGEWTGFDSFGAIGQRLHRQLRAVAGERGIKCDPHAWYAKQDDALYLPLGGRVQNLVELSRNGIRQVKNGTNGVVIMPNDRFVEFKWDENFNEKVGQESWSRFISLFTCSDEDRAMLDAWLTAIFLYDFNETHPLMRFVGAPGSGKSFAAKLLTTLILGTPSLNIATTAAMYRVTANQPIFCLDNVEAQHMTEDLHTFLLLAATGANKLKSNTNTASDVIAESIKSWIVTTGIDPVSFGKRELVERTVIVPFGVNRAKDFMPRRETQWVSTNREILLNFLYRRAWRTLLRIQDSELDRAISSLPENVRPRLRDFYALLMVARNLTGGDDMIRFMLSEHSDDETEATINDNPLVTLIQQLPFFLGTTLGKEIGVSIQLARGGSQTNWISGQRLFVALSMCSKHCGMKFPYETPQHLSIRIGLAKSQMEALGYKLEKSENRVVDGKRSRAWRIFIPTVSGEQTPTLFEGAQE